MARTVTPGLPDEYGCEPYRAGAASCSASKAPSRSAPREQDTANLSAIQNAGIAIPITKCCRSVQISPIVPAKAESGFPELSICRRCWSARLAFTITFSGYGSRPAPGRHRECSVDRAISQLVITGLGPVIPMNWASRFEYRDGRNMSGHDRDTSHDLSAVVPAQSLAVILASGSAQAHARKVHVQP